jgi:hypothetical protein
LYSNNKYICARVTYVKPDDKNLNRLFTGSLGHIYKKREDRVSEWIFKTHIIFQFQFSKDMPIPPVCLDVSDVIWPFVTDVYEKYTQGLDPVNHCDFLTGALHLVTVFERLQIMPMLRKHTVWPHDRPNDSGCLYDTYYNKEAEMYVYPDTRSMLENLLFMYDITSSVQNYSSPETFSRGLIQASQWGRYELYRQKIKTLISVLSHLHRE